MTFALDPALGATQPRGKARVATFFGGSDRASGAPQWVMHPWYRPDNLVGLMIICVGAGGGGGAGMSGLTNTVRCGGGSGAAAAFCTVILPAWAIPPVLYIYAGTGGVGGTVPSGAGIAGGNSGVFCTQFDPSTAGPGAQSCYAFARGGGAGGGGTTGAGAAGGVPTISTIIADCRLAAYGVFQALAGLAGVASSATGAAGTAATGWFATTPFGNGASGGGVTSGNAQSSGGASGLNDGTTTPRYFGPSLSGGGSATAAKSGWSFSGPLLCGIGGSGGGGSTTSTTAGGDGGLGSGGGGGGGGSAAGAAGGRGGTGVIQLFPMVA